MPEFTDAKIQKRVGAPRVAVPPELAQWLETSYSTGKCCEIPAEDDEETRLFLRLARIYANRQRRSVDHEFTRRNGTSILRFRMRDRRPYTMTAREAMRHVEQ